MFLCGGAYNEIIIESDAPKKLSSILYTGDLIKI